MFTVIGIFSALVVALLVLFILVLVQMSYRLYHEVYKHLP